MGYVVWIFFYSTLIASSKKDEKFTEIWNWKFNDQVLIIKGLKCIGDLVLQPELSEAVV